MKKRILLLTLFCIIFLVNSIIASDVAYIIKKANKEDQSFLNIFNEMGLNVDLIESKNIKTTDFSKYDLIFIDNNRLRNSKYIPVNEYPSVIANSYYGKTFELLYRGRIPKLASNSKLKIKKNGELVQIYDRPAFKLGGIGIPYFYLPDKYKNNNMETIATTAIGYKKEPGDVISYSTQGPKKCFFGITETKYWTQDAKDLFKDCVSFVLDSSSKPPEEPPEEPQEPECTQDSDCGENSFIGNPFCNDSNVYHNFQEFKCMNSSTPESYCINSTEPILIEECIYGCENGECLEEHYEIHDITLIENYDDFNHTVRLKDSENNILQDDIPILQCNQEYKIQFKTKNIGNFIEDIEVNLTIMNSTDAVFENIKSKTGLEIGAETIIGNKNSLIFNFSTGKYTISVESSITGFPDDNPLNNFAQREIEIVCGE